MTEVTDPSILAQLNEPVKLKEVTDPSILAQLNGTSEKKSIPTIQKEDTVKNPFEQKQVQKKEPSFLDKITTAFHEDLKDNTPLTTEQKLDLAKKQYAMGRRSKEYVDSLQKQVNSELYAQHNAEKMKTRIAQQEFTKQPISQQLQQELLDIPTRSLKTTVQGLAELPASIVGSKTAQAVHEALGGEDKFTKAYPHLAMAESMIVDPTMIGAKLGVSENVVKNIITKHDPIIQAVKDGTLHPQQAEEILKTYPNIKSFTDIVAENINKELPPISETIDKALVSKGEEPHFKPMEQQPEHIKALSPQAEEIKAPEVAPTEEPNVSSVEPKSEEPMFSKGEYITPEQRIANRDEWHKDSHPLTKNEDGTPKTFYHGTNADFNNFDSENIFTTSSKDSANTYSLKDGHLNSVGSNVMPVHINTKNPLIVDAKGKDFGNIIFNGERESTNSLANYAKDNGYDGLIVKNVKDDYNQNINTKKSDVVVSFNPKQIKSIHNTGEYNTKSADILHSKSALKGSTTTEAIHAQAKKLLGKQYENLKGDMNIVQSYKDLPQSLRDRAEKFSSGGMIRGVYETSTGKVHLVADTMKPEHVNGVLVHELLHKAKAKGEKVLGELHDTFVLRLKQLKEEPLVKQALKSVTDAGTISKHVDEEMMSYLVEKYQHGREMSPRLRKFVSDIIDHVKVFAAKTAVKLGVDAKWLVSKMNEKDIAALLKSSAIKQSNKTVTKDGLEMFSKMTKKEMITHAADKVTEHIQDYWKPAEKYLKSVEGEKVNDARKLIFGRTGTRIEKVRAAQYIISDDVINYAEKSGDKVDDIRKELNMFMIAQHAPERNAALKDSAAGISTKAAQDSLAQLKQSNPQKYKFFEQMANNVRKLNEQTLDVLLDGQVITKELYDNLRSKYSMHVPLQRVMPEDKEISGSITGGKGLSVKSTGIKAAKGSDLEVADILGNVSSNVQEAIIRAEKNKVGLAMYDLFKSDKSLGEARGLHMIGKDLKDMPIMETPSDNSIVLYKDGKKKILIPNDPILAQVYNQLNVAEKGIVADIIAPITRTLAGLYTRLNPEFAFSNVIRDIQESMIYNASEMGAKNATGALAKQAWGMNGVRDVLWGNGKSEAGKLYEQMKMDGGTTGGITLATRTKIQKDIDDVFKVAQSNPRKAIEKVFESIDNFNSIFEDGTRLAAYKQALDAGLSRERAAVIAKETTIDFNRKGAQTPWMNAIWMFSNASVQGSYKMLRAMKNPKVLASTMGILSAATVSNNVHNDMIDPDWRDKISDFERGSNFVILLDNKDGKLRRVDIPIGWGIKPIKVMADTLDDVRLGKNKGNGTVKVLKSIASGYNPLGGNSMLQTAMPTLGDVATDIYTNTSYSGSAITPKGSELENPSKRYYPETPETFGGRLAIKVSQGTEKLGLDLTPEDIKYITRSYGGGPLNFSTGLYTVLDDAIHGQNIKEEDRVMMRRFYKASDPERVNKYVGSQDIKEMIKKMQDAKTKEDRISILKDYLPRIPDNQKKQAINAVKYGGLLPNKKNVIQARDEAQWEQDIFAPFKSTSTKQKELK